MQIIFIKQIRLFISIAILAVYTAELSLKNLCLDDNVVSKHDFKKLLNSNDYNDYSVLGCLDLYSYYYKSGSDQLACLDKSRRAENNTGRIDNEDTHIDALQVDGVDTTGAGDAFCGGLLLGLLRSDDYHTAVLYGLVSSSMVLEGYGAQYAFALDRDKAYARLAFLQMRHRETKRARL